MKNLFLILSSSILLFLSSCTNPCDNITCFNDGICIDGTCECPDGFEGDDCSIMIEYNSCNNENYIYYHGETYDIIEINGKCWFTKNLKTEKFSNGDNILKENDLSNWWPNEYMTPMYYDSHNSIDEGYGYLYNGYVVNDERNVCPNGWHVSSDEDWIHMESFIGMDESELESTDGQRGLGHAGKIKSSPSDSPLWNGTNNFGLSLVPSGEGIDGHFSSKLDTIPLEGVYWTSDDYPGLLDYMIIRRIYTSEDYDVILRSPRRRTTALSIRCVKD